MSEREHDWVIRADLPEVERSDINLFVSNQELTITAPSKPSTGMNGNGFYRAERRLPVGVFSDEIKASFREGVLEISLPKSDEPMRRVPIDSDCHL
jgi:HSP20 family protein